MQKFSSFGRKKKKQTKIRHRMVMLEDLQLCLLLNNACRSVEKGTHASQCMTETGGISWVFCLSSL